MKTMCAWCNKVIKDETVTDGDKVSHGICKECKEMVKKEMEEMNGKPALEPLDTYQLIKH